MKVVVMNGSGEPRNVLSINERNDPSEPEYGQAVVRIKKRIIHPADYQTIRGYLPKEVFTHDGVPGIDGVGVVEAINSQDGHATGLSVGTRVIVYHTRGTWAERVVVPVSSLMPVPDDINDSVACQLATNGITGLMLLNAAQQSASEPAMKAPLLVTAANSGVAQNVIALAIAAGHQVTGLVRRQADTTILKERFNQADFIGTDQDNWEEKVKRVAVKIPEVAIDPIGGQMASTLLGLLPPGGTLITYGALDPQAAQIHTGFLTSLELTIKGCSAIGWATRTSTEQRVADFNSLFNLVRKSPEIYGNTNEFSFNSVVDAVASAESSPRRGATILVSDE
ncbi:zinc-binding dehydrogenase [Dickeya chrysanthemi]|uniref:zinc-binding dehydrogenase n=1 Tax=Dickeya chrysanthemi TaxID=556 RepID=UPI00039D0ABA|nr:zinc-binding dehydrogenase [Dickeya chrysanthemi]